MVIQGDDADAKTHATENGSSGPDIPDLDQYFSIGEAAFAEIIKRFKAKSPETLVEFGSGGSTVRLALALPETKIFSVEHSQEYAEKTQTMLEQFQLSEQVTLSVAPLKRQRFGAAFYSTYDLSNAALPERIDVALIDGPPGNHLGGREAVLYGIWPHLASDCLVVLDDLFRHHEQRALVHWASAFPGQFSLQQVDVCDQLAFLQFNQRASYRTSFNVTVGHYMAHLGRIYHNHFKPKR